MADTGNTTTLTLATSALTAAVESIDIGEETREALEDSDLTTTNYMTYIPGDLRDPPELTFNILWNQSDSSFPSTSTAAELCTVTYGLLSGETVNATFTATGFITAVKRPEIANNQIMRASITFKCDGKSTEPTDTAGS